MRGPPRSRPVPFPPFLNLGCKAGRREAAAWSVARGSGAPAGGHTCAAADLAGAGRISRAVAVDLAGRAGRAAAGKA
uniref:Uncharacterized protein n=1 Tax=Aegilops tauschii subsp. strangulata TaxID=200361 RepID=A0A453CVG7_AEGTS